VKKDGRKGSKRIIGKIGSRRYTESRTADTDVHSAGQKRGRRKPVMKMRGGTICLSVTGTGQHNKRPRCLPMPRKNPDVHEG
jgi:hypothetical protein